MTRFHGVFTPNSKHRARVTPAKRAREGEDFRTADPEEPASAKLRVALLGQPARRAWCRSRGRAQIRMDCNDVLMEICRYNGSIMWEREEWNQFRSRRLPRWMQVFEESLKRGLIGKDRVSFADVGVFAMFGNMTRCLPEFEPDLLRHAPGIHALCQSIGSEPSLAKYVSDEELKYGRLYCGGQIEKSIRKMIAMDAEWG